MLTALPLFTGAVLLGAAGAASIYYATYAVRSQWIGPTIWHGRRDTGAVALTFDDGPAPDTDQLLTVLEAYGVRSTFFMIGQQVERFPQTARRVAERGHEIGNHSYSHPVYLYRSARETRRQLELTQQIIRDVTGVRAGFARPPCGVRTLAYFRSARRLGLRTVQWDVAGFDWKGRSGEQIAHEVLRKVRAGSIILLHDGDSAEKQDRRETVAALPLIIEGIRARGLRVSPLCQLLEEEAKFAA